MEYTSYTKEERETIIRTDDCQDYFEVDSFQPKFCNKIRKLKNVIILLEETTEKGTIMHGQYKLPLNQITFRNPKIMTDENRKNLIERMNVMRESRKSED